MNLLRRTTVLSALLSVTLPHTTAALQPEEGPAEEGAPQEIPWFLRPGIRIGQIRTLVPTVDRVVLVRDEASFVEAISQWSLVGRWPVLFEDDRYAPMFIRRFAPAEIIRFSAAEPGDISPDSAARNAIIARAWSMPGDGEVDDPLAAWASVEWSPPGVVVLQEGHEAWPAALALAADRGQPLQTIAGEWSDVNATTLRGAWEELHTKVRSAVESTGLAYAQLGDEVDVVTLVGEFPAKYRIETATAAIEPALTGDAEQITLAMTDGVCRDWNDAAAPRWAATGWLFGSRERATYQAMCSIFLPVESALLFDTYPRDQEGWREFSLAAPQERLESDEIDVQTIARPASDAATWRGLSPRGLERDLIMVTTKGNAGWCEMADRRRALAQDVPVLSHPAIVFFLHSWSAMLPGDGETLAGRWLERGAAWYLGSVDEPYLTGFVPPSVFIERARAGVPLGIAALPLAEHPWKITSIGDPLTMFGRAVPRQSPQEAGAIAGERINETMEARLTEAKGRGEWAEAFALLRLLGRDDLVVRLYEGLLLKEADEAEIAAAIPGLFRAGTTARLIEAVERLPAEARTREVLDLVWARASADLASLDAESARRLAGMVRGPARWADAAALAPVLRRLGLAGEARAVLEGARESATDGYAQRALEAAGRE